MTTHTDLIARLRSGWTTDCLLAANALEALDQQVAELTAQRDRAEQQVKELLWDDPVEPSFGPAFGDLLVYLNHQTPHPTEIYQMMADGAKLWQQMKDQVAVLTKERDELEISNAFAHGEWRAVKDQLAALTRAVDTDYEQLYREANDQLDAAQAREAKLREALAGLREHSLCPDTMVRLLDTPADDSALQERLKQERERVALWLIKCGHPKPVIDAIRSMT